jgi:hypothetical protein
MSLQDGVEERKKSKSIAIVEEERTIGDGSSAHVIRGARDLKARRTGHAAKIGRGVSAKEPTRRFWHGDARPLFRGLTPA